MDGFSFSFDKEKSEAASSAASSQSGVQPNGGSVASHSSAQAREDAARELGTPKRRGRPPGATSVKRATDSELAERVNGAIAAQLAQLHSPEAWSALACLPADAARTWTGAERWKISDEERRTLGLTCSAAAQTFMITNPRALACAMAAAAIIGTYAPRAIAQLQEMRETADKKAAEKKAAQ